MAVSGSRSCTADTRELLATRLWPNQPLQPTAAATLVWRSSWPLSAAAAAELSVRPRRGGAVDIYEHRRRVVAKAGESPPIGRRVEELRFLLPTHPPHRPLTSGRPKAATVHCRLCQPPPERPLLGGPGMGCGGVGPAGGCSADRGASPAGCGSSSGGAAAVHRGDGRDVLAGKH